MGRIKISQEAGESLILLIIGILICGLVALGLISCKSIQYVPVESVRDVYHNKTDTLRDSIYHEVLIDHYSTGDTMYITRYEYIYKDKLSSKNDTLIINDTIRVPYPVEKQLTKWQQLKQDWFGALICVLLAFLACVVILTIFMTKTRQRQNL